MEQVKYDKKVTAKEMGLEKKLLQAYVAENPKPSDVLSVLALVTGMKIEPSKLNPAQTNTRFQGQFEVKNLLTDEVHYASEAFFPGPAEAYLTAAKQQAGESAITVAMTITVAEDKTPNSATGYKFGVKPFVDKNTQDPFKALRALLPAAKAKAKDAATAKK